MDLHIPLDPEGPVLSTQVYSALADAILDGRLRPGDRLPPSRELARDLSVARSTVVYAYERLSGEGFVDARVGAGTYVSDALRRPRQSRRPEQSAFPEPLPVAPFWRDVTLQDRTSGADSLPVIHDFSVGVPDARLFPIATWRRLVVAHLQGDLTQLGTYDDALGTPSLRRAIARHIGRARSVRCEPGDVVVTRGAQQAFDLLGRVLIDSGTRVGVEDPGYPPARDLYRSLGAEVVPIPVSSDGLDVEAIPSGTRVIHVTPSHQFPLGTAMSLAARGRLLAWAEDNDAVIVEDDYDSEFRFVDRPLDPLHLLDRSRRVAYVGSFSKTMLPGLRLGFLVAPAALRPALQAAKALADGHTDTVTQGALAQFIDEGHLSRHLRRARRVYARRHAALLDVGIARLAPWLQPVPSAAGLHVTFASRPDAHVDLTVVVAAARRRGVMLDRLANYGMTSPVRDGVVLGYGRIDEELVEPGVMVLEQCLRDAQGSAHV